MSVIDTLFHIFEGSQPENGTAENKKKAQAVYDANKDHIQGVLASLTPAAAPAEAPISIDASANPAAITTSPANAAQSSFDVNSSTAPVVQKGQLDIPPIQAPVVPVIPPIQDQPALSAAPAPTAPVAPVTAPSPAAQTPGNAPTASKSLESAIVTPESQDNEKRQQMLNKLEQQKKLGLIPSALGGVADALGNAAKPFGGQGSSGNQEAVLAQQKDEEATQKGQFEAKIKNDPNSDTSKAYRTMVLQIAPSLANNPDFQKMSAQSIGEKLPLIDTMMKAKASEDMKKIALEQAKNSRDTNVGLRQDQQQDRLEQQARQGILNLRGDKSLARSEEQRDAAITAVNRIKEVHAAGQELNPIDYTDILSQIYKARSGNSPGEQVLQDIRQPLGSAKFNQAWTFMTGQQAPATSRSISDSLLNMATSMGQQADKFHEGYMKPHLVKPTGLNDDRWQPILNTARGVSFKDATATSNTAPQGGMDLESKRAALRQKLGI